MARRWHGRRGRSYFAPGGGRANSGRWARPVPGDNLPRWQTPKACGRAMKWMKDATITADVLDALRADPLSSPLEDGSQWGTLPAARVAVETLVSLPADAALTKPQERGVGLRQPPEFEPTPRRSLLQDSREVREKSEHESEKTTVKAEPDRPVRPLLPGTRPPGWVAIVVAVVLVGAVCWLAYNTDATRIEVPGVITWERARARDEPGTSRQSRRIPTDPPECTSSGPSASTTRAAAARVVRTCDDLPDLEAGGP
jgi:hypothetical protein